MIVRILLIAVLIGLGWCLVQSVLHTIETILWKTYWWMMPG